MCMTDRSVQEAAKAAWLARQGNEPSWKQSQAAPEPETVLPDLREQLQSMDQELAESARKLEALQQELAMAEAAAQNAQSKAAEAAQTMMEDAARAAWLAKQDGTSAKQHGHLTPASDIHPVGAAEEHTRALVPLHAGLTSDALAKLGKELFAAVPHPKEALHELSSAGGTAKEALRASGDALAALSKTRELSAAADRLYRELAAVDSPLSGAAKETLRASEAMVQNITTAVPPAIDAIRASSDALGRELSAADSPVRHAAHDTARLSGEFLKNVGEVLVLNKYSKDKLTKTSKTAHELAGASPVTTRSLCG